MNIQTTAEAAPQINADVVIVTSRPDGQLSAAAQAIDTASGGAITRLIDAGELSGKENEVVTLLAPGGVAAVQVLVLGLMWGVSIPAIAGNCWYCRCWCRD